MKKLILVLAFAAFAASLIPRAGHACQCDIPPVLTDYEWADAVFTGIVFSIGPASDPNYLEVLVIVTGVWKGVSTQLINVYTAADDGACRYAFDEGVEYIIYASSSTSACCQGVWTSMCNRTNPLYAAQADLDVLGPPGSVPAEMTSWGRIKALFE